MCHLMKKVRGRIILFWFHIEESSRKLNSVYYKPPFFVLKQFEYWDYVNAQEDDILNLTL